MINQDPLDILAGPPAQLQSTISCTSYSSITCTSAAGEPLNVALIDAHGRVIEAGPEVAKAIRRAGIRAAMQALQAQGHLTVTEGNAADRWLMPPSQVASRQRRTSRAAA